MAEALYRKYRPQVFEDVVGQEPIERTLKNAIRQDKVSHAYLFCGPRGTGKTTTARLLAKALLCERGPTPDPDGTCEDCLLIADGVHPDVYELDAASRTGVENVREEIISRVHFAPTRGRYKVYIIDEVHMLSTAAFNALLKTLEEPPPHVVFVLCTTDPQKVPETIHSRCQRFDFHRISPESMVARLGAICMAEEVEFEGEALDLIAQRADGGLRNALTSLEQIIAFENGKVTLAGAERLLGSIDSNDMAEILAYIGKRDIANCFRWTAAYVETGADLAQFVRDMSEHVRNLYVMALVGDDADIEVTETARRELANELGWFGPDRASRLLGVLGDLMAELKTTSNPRLAFEIALTRMVRPDSDLTLEALAERVEALESGYSAVAHVLPGKPFTTSAEGVGDRPASDANRAENYPAAEDAPVSAGAPYPVEETVTAPMNAARPMDDSNPPSAIEDKSQAVDARPVVDGASKASTLANPAALQRVWQAALADVKNRKQAYGVLFMNTKAVFDESLGMVRVVFPAESTFAFNAVQKPDVQQALEEALAKTVGETVRFCYEKSDEREAQRVSAQVERPTSAQVERPTSVQVERREPVQAERQIPAQVAQHAQSQEAQAAQAAPGKTGSQAPGSVSAQAPMQGHALSADEAPYDQVPYEDMVYDQVPYDDADVVYSQLAAPVSHATEEVISDGSVYSADVDTMPSPGDLPLTPDGAVREDPAAIEALLQASFGGGVVFSETDE